jgi:hypothetical protein
MPEWRRLGLLSFTINLQGGSPEGYSKEQPWHNSAFDEQGSLRSAYLLRLSKILDRADELGMAPIVGCFYFGQDQRLKDDAALKKAVSNTADWLLEKGYRNILLEISTSAITRATTMRSCGQIVCRNYSVASRSQRGGRRLVGAVSAAAFASAGALLLIFCCTAMA